MAAWGMPNVHCKTGVLRERERGRDCRGLGNHLHYGRLKKRRGQDRLHRRAGAGPEPCPLAGWAQGWVHLRQDGFSLLLEEMPRCCQLRRGATASGHEIPLAPGWRKGLRPHQPGRMRRWVRESCGSPEGWGSVGPEQPPPGEDPPPGAGAKLETPPTPTHAPRSRPVAAAAVP